MDSDISKLVKINIILKYNKDMLVITALEYIRHYIIREDKDRMFSLLVLILSSNNLD